MRVLCVFLLLSTAAWAGWEESRREISRGDFPEDFVFGSGTSAYQVEGAAAEDGRTPSVWDTFSHAGKSMDEGTGDLASDGYHKYKEDIKLMEETGLEAYRFSISWSRLLPNGRGNINPKGLEYYNNLIDELVRHGIQPHATLFHYDLPQVLEDEYGGWLSPKIVDDFVAYAEVCFREFGDRVSHWTTLNEPNVLALGGYDQGIFPPQRCSYPFGSHCPVGDSTLEPYVAAHHCLLAHAAAASLYKSKYQVEEHGGGSIGLNIFAYYFAPLTNSPRDMAATQRAHDFYTGWFMGPLVNGDYPITMKKRTGKKMPSFTPHQRNQVIGSFDFLGINHYATLWVEDKDISNATTDQRDFFGDLSVNIVVRSSTDGTPTNEVPITPHGMHGLLEYFKQNYGNPPIYIHENGYPTPHNSSLEDTARVQYLQGYIGSLLDALRDGSDARGYFTWSFLDVFELMGGYQSSYGLYYVDFEDEDRRRIPKSSARWYTSFLTAGKGGHGPLKMNNSSHGSPSRLPGGTQVSSQQAKEATVL